MAGIEGTFQMKSLTLFLLRLSTGLLMVVWGLIKIQSPQAAIGVSNKYYGGTISADALQMPLGALQVLVGILVIAGIFRRIVYPIQAVWLVLGAVTIWRYILDPFGLYLFASSEEAQVLFFPSFTVAIAAIILLVYRDDDDWSVDRAVSRG